MYIRYMYVYIAISYKRNPADWKIPALKEIDLLSVELQRIAQLLLLGVEEKQYLSIHHYPRV